MNELGQGPQEATIETRSSTIAVDASPAADESDELELGLDNAQDSASASDTAAQADASQISMADSSGDGGIRDMDRGDLSEVFNLELGLDNAQDNTSASDTAASADASQVYMADSTGEGGIRDMDRGDLSKVFNDGPTKEDAENKDGRGAPGGPELVPPGPNYGIEHMLPRNKDSDPQP